uniref:Uncharacterized protein n=1 Tax=Plectus sambesii TaxID=2011161 RepID=A0A914VSK4_9BILA
MRDSREAGVVRVSIKGEITSGTPSQSTTCGTEGFEFACSTGEGATILVDYAAYGVVDDKLPSACQSGTQRLGDGFCTHPAALSTMIQRCQGLSYCKLPPLQEVFMDSPCTPGSPTYLDYRFRCQTEPLTRCIAGASYFQGRCYTVNYQPNRTDRLTWQLARKQCWEKGGELAGPIDETVHNFLAGRIQSTRNDSVNYFWIGMSNTANNGPVWISGNPATDYSPTGSVYNGSDDCVAYYYSPKPAGTFWKNSTCDGYYNWICEYAPIESERPTLFDPNWNVPTTIGPIYVPKTTLPPTSMPAPTRAQQVDPITINDQSEYSTAPPPMTAVSNMVTTTTSGPTQNSAFGNIVECPETTWKGITFAKTAAGNDATAPCPNPTSTTGQIRYQCTKVGNAAQWSAKGASMIECRHKWVGDLHEKIVLKKAAENISRELHMQLGSTVDLYGGDISGSVDIAEKLIPLAKEQFSYTFDTTDRNKRAADFTHTMGAAGDQLLSERAIPLWDEFAKNDRISMASNLMGVLEQGANLLATYLERSSKAFTYQNWAMRVQVHRSQMQPMGGGSSPGVSSFSAPSAGPEDDAMRPVQLPGRPDMMPTREGFTVNSDVFNFRPSDDTLSNEPVTNTFVNFSNAPSMSLPSFNVLKSALRTEGGPVNQPLPEDDDPTAKLAPAAASEQDDSVKLGYYMFTSLGALLNADDKTIINSHVIGASVNDPERSLKLPEDAPATFTFYHLRKEGVSNVRCVFWNSTERKWSENGCHIVKTSKEATDCSCDHLTSFAILMDLTGDAEGSLSSTNAEILNIITIVGCALSIVCLVLCIIVFTCFRSLWNNRNTIHRNLCICLLLAELVFVIGIDRTENATVCSAIAVALHYLFLAAFCWMLLEGYQLYLMLIQVFESEKSKVLVYLLWAYGFPAVVVAVSAGVAWQNYGTEN